MPPRIESYLGALELSVDRKAAQTDSPDTAAQFREATAKFREDLIARGISPDFHISSDGFQEDLRVTSDELLKRSQESSPKISGPFDLTTEAGVRDYVSIGEGTAVRGPLYDDKYVSYPTVKA